MHIISRKRLLEFVTVHADSETALDTWYRIAKVAEWQNLVELREAYPSADLVGIYTVFNIKGNHYRLIGEINYRSGTIFVRDILTHADTIRIYGNDNSYIRSRICPIVGSHTTQSY